MNPDLAQREVALAGIALLAAMVALAIASAGSSGSSTHLPEAVPAPGGGWYEALAGVRTGGFGSGLTECGARVDAKTLGVANPVLRCGGKIFVSFGDVVVLTQVIARGPYGGGRQFDLTPALADKLGVEGDERIRWRFAKA
jgi:hypothetical protein